MIDGKSVRKKLIGSNDERAVSPVIGVILMVAITVILAAVIAAFVLDMGSGVKQEAQGAANMNVDSSNGEVTVEVTSLNNADYIVLEGAAEDISTGTDWDTGSWSYNDQLKVGDTVTLSDTSGSSSAPSPSSGTVTAVAVVNAGEDNEARTKVGSVEFDFS